MAIVGTLMTQVKANTTQFRREMKRSKTSAVALRMAVARIGAAANLFAIGMGVVAIGALVSFTKQSFKAIDATAKLGRELEIGTAALMNYQLAAGLSGVDVATLNKSMEKMAKIVGEARLGVSTGTLAMRDFGMSIEELEGLSTQEIFEKFADEISLIEDPMKRAAKASLIFGRSGIKLLNFLSLGSEGFAKLSKTTEALGVALTEVDASKVEAANDAMLKVKTVMIGIGNVMAVELSPWITQMAEGWLIWKRGAEGVANAVDKVVNAFAGRKASDLLIKQTNLSIKLWKELAQTQADIKERGLAKIERLEFNHLARAQAENAEFLRGVLADQEAIAKAREATAERVQKAEEAARAAAQKADDARLRAIENIKAEVNSIFEQTRTPLEAVEAEIKRVYELMGKGFGHDLHMGLVRRLKELRKQQDGILNPKDKALEDKTSTTFKQIDLKNIILGGEGGKKTQDKQLDESKKHTQFLMEIAKQGMRGSGTARAVAS